ncbi:MAG: hypothetical protein R3F48_16350 [Candidatus Zixiibacteriota bacterium]
MKRYGSIKIVILVGCLLAVLGGCETQKPLSPEQELIMSKCENLFLRVKVGDYAVIYENEFPYLREKIDFEEFMDDPYLKSYNPDTLVAVELDSVTVWDDTAYVHMKLEYIHPDSTYTSTSINLRYWYIDDEWIKPSRSDYKNQLLFEEEMRIYWEAVEAMKAREKKQEEQGDSL